MVLLITSVGGHWAVLQGVAWTTMFARFAQSMPLAQAVCCTFDGRHPCKLCQTIKQGRAAEKKQDPSPVRPGSKLDFGLVWQAPDYLGGCAQERIASLDTAATPRREEPPKPRPRGGFPNRYA